MTYKDNNISIERINSDTSELFDSGYINPESSRPYGNLFFPFLMDNGGANDISITVDVVEKSEVQQDYQESNWEKNVLKNDKHITNSNLIWVFKECTNQNKIQNNIFNAFCFCGQKLNLLIAKTGHTSGLLNGEKIYCKNNIKIYLTDIVNGTRTLIKDFNDFDSDIDNEERKVEIQVPEENVHVDLKYGLFGMLALSLEVTGTPYHDASFKTPYEEEINISSQSHLQILTYSAKQEAKKVHNALSETINLFNEDILGTETFDELFQKSTFNDFDGNNNQPLNSDQKRAIITDQIAVLFMSQHPVLTSDYYPSKVIGLGCEAAEKPTFINSLVKNVSRKYPEIIPTVKNRLYGMLCSYQTFAYHQEIDNYFNGFSNSQQFIRDPAKIVSVSKFDSLKNDFGIDGTVFNPLVLENTHAEIPKQTDSSQEFNIKLTNNSVFIDEITISDENDNVILTTSNNLKLSFNVVEGEDKITRIRYSAWIHGNLIWMEHVDDNGTSREHTFYFGSYGHINISGSGTSLTSGDIINTRVDIEDGFGFVNTFYKDYVVPDEKYIPSILNMSAIQGDTGDGKINVYFNYFGASEVNNTIIKAYYSFDNSTWKQIEKNMTGDIGLGVMPGFKQFTWYPWHEIPSISKFIYLKISLEDVDQYTNKTKWTNKSVITHISLSRPNVAIRRLSAEELLEMEISSSSSSTSSSSTSSSSSSSSESSISSESSFIYDIKNLIILIGDGMGEEHAQAASIYKTGSEDQLIWQTDFVNQATINTDNYSGGVTDSAAAATALATGQKVSNGVISIDIPWGTGTTELRTILEFAKEHDKKTALITTTSITDATVAAFAAHETSRNFHTNIANDYLTQTIPNIIFGAKGTAMSKAAAESAGYTVVEDKWAMLNLDDSTEFASGQFGTSGQYLTDYETWRPFLYEMTEVGIDLVKENDNGFFMVVEGALIDHASTSPSQDIGKVIDEVLEFEKAVQAAYDFAADRNDTMIIVMSDHETGGLQIDVNNGIGVLPDVTWTDIGHTNTPVKVFVWGPQSQDISGSHHTDIYEFIMTKLFPESSTSTSSSSLSTDDSSLSSLSSLSN